MISDEDVEADDGGLGVIVEGCRWKDRIVRFLLLGIVEVHQAMLFSKNCNQYVRKYKPNMLVIMETSCDPSKSTKSFNRMGYDDIVVVVNESFVGGIVVPDW